MRRIWVVEICRSKKWVVAESNASPWVFWTRSDAIREANKWNIASRKAGLSWKYRAVPYVREELDAMADRTRSVSGETPDKGEGL